MYVSQITKDRIKKICKIKKINMEHMLTACNLGVNAIRQISDAKGMSSFALAKIADYLGCSVDYLLGRTDDPGQFADDKKKPIPFMGSANPGSAVLIAKGGDGQQLVAAPRPELLELYEIAVGLNNQHMSILLGLAKDLKSLEENGK